MKENKGRYEINIETGTLEIQAWECLLYFSAGLCSSLQRRDSSKDKARPRPRQPWQQHSHSPVIDTDSATVLSAAWCS